MPGLNDRAFVQVSFNCRSLVVREPSVTMHLQTLLQQSLQFVFGTTFHEHVPVRACRLGDFISLVVIVSFTVRDGAAAALPLIWEFCALSERQNRTMAFRTHVCDVGSRRKIHIVIGFKRLCTDAHASQAAFCHIAFASLIICLL